MKRTNMTEIDETTLKRIHNLEKAVMFQGAFMAELCKDKSVLMFLEHANASGKYLQALASFDCIPEPDEEFATPETNLNSIKSYKIENK